MIYSIIALTVLVGVCSLAVDVGRVQLVKTELRRTCDAAARYAVNGARDGTALAKANWISAQNAVEGATHTFAAGDVEVGKWDAASRTFAPNVTPINAVRVTARRTAATNNPIPTVIARSVGVQSVDLTVRAIAMVKYVGYGVVGLDYIYMTGNSSDSYWSNGRGGSGAGQYGSIASNGNITLNGSSSVHGDARPGVGGTVYGASAVTGSTAPLTTPLSFPNGSAGSYATTNDNDNVPPGNRNASSFRVKSNDVLDLPGGNYYYNNVDISGTLRFSGPATIYCYGNFSMSGQAVTTASKPGNLRVVMCPDSSGTAPGNVSIGSGAALYADVYAPQSAVTLSGSGDIYGSVLGRSVSMTGTSAIHYDLSLHPDNGKVLLVE